jgi:hypothetical protein
LRPSADRTVKRGKQGLKLNRIEALKNGEKELRPFGHRSVELEFDVCFQQSVYGGWVKWLKDAGRGT